MPRRKKSCPVCHDGDGTYYVIVRDAGMKPRDCPVHAAGKGEIHKPKSNPKAAPQQAALPGVN